MSRQRKSKSRKKSARPSLISRCWRLVRWPFGLGLLALIVWIVVLDIEVRDKFDGRKWALPARVYAQPLELYLGKQLAMSALRQELQALEYRPVAVLSGPGQWRLHDGRVEIATRAYAMGGRAESERHLRLRIQSDRVIEFQVLRGQSDALVALEPVMIGGIYPGRQEDRELVRLAEVPALLGEALIAVEDRNFVEHYGVSLKSIARAAWVNIQSGRVVQGGSTLTQQLVKNFFLDHSRKLSRKITEALMSLLLEWHYSKSEILETYMNEVYLGQSGPREVHGFGLAARHYFGRPLDRLDTPEVALLVGLVKGASYYNPWRHPERARERRNVVLRVLHQQGLIDEQQFNQAAKSPLGIIAADRRRLHDYPAFIDLVKRQLRRDYSNEALSSEGLRVFSSLSLSAQRSAEQALTSRLKLIENQRELEVNSLQGAVVITALGSGEIEALVGDRNASFAGFNRALDATRPIGSLVKPAVFLSALKDNGGYHLASLISDDPVTVGSNSGERWQPKNFDLKSHGDVFVIDALSRSYNQATARLGMTVGLEAVAQTLRELGVSRPIEQVPSLLLGALELSAADVSLMYHSIANEGVVMPLRAIRSVEDSAGNPLSRYPLTLDTPVDPVAVELLQHALQAVMNEGTGRSVAAQVPGSLELAGKTGTTNDQRDSWFAGFSGRHVAVVWVGRDDNGTTPLTGSSGALKVWGDIFASLPTQGIEVLSSPDVVYLWVDEDNGALSSENCRGARLMPFRKGQQPRQRAECEWVESPVWHWMKKWF